MSLETVLEALLRSSWRIWLGVFVASTIMLVFASLLDIRDWAHAVRPYLVALCIGSGVVVATHLVTTVHSSISARRQKKIDLHIVGGSPMFSNWTIGASPIDKKPMLILICDINFAHGGDTSAVIRRAYLEGTKQIVPMGDIVVEGAYDEKTTLCIHVSPVKAKPGKKLVGRLVFVDQFADKHRSDKITFRPNTMPSDFQIATVQRSPNCVFCGKPVELAGQAKEAQMTAHIQCVWP
jgi:hypothetical protein